MKQIIIFMSLLIASVATGQDVYPPQSKFYWFPDNNYAARDSIYLSKDSSSMDMNDRFYLGWHWGNSRKLTEALQMNGAHMGLSYADQQNAASSYAPNTGIVRAVKDFFSGWGSEPTNAVAVQWEPSLLLDSTQLGKLQTRQHDTEKSVFGFRNVTGTVTNTSSDSNYQILRLVRVGGYINTQVLRRNWPDDEVKIVDNTDLSN